MLLELHGKNLIYLGMSGRKYYLSVCKPLSPVHSLCPGHLTSVCATDHRTSEFFNLGSVSSKEPKFELKTTEKDVLMLTYDQGASCNDKYNFTSQIIFRCNSVERGPKLYDSLDNCTYIFEWQTPEACPVVEAEKSKGNFNTYRVSLISILP